MQEEYDFNKQIEDKKVVFEKAIQDLYTNSVILTLFNVDTLEVVGSDQEDFVEVSKRSIKEALRIAFGTGTIISATEIAKDINKYGL